MEARGINVSPFDHAERSKLPPRPYIPPSFAGALVCCISAGASIETGWRAYLASDASRPVATQALIALAPLVLLSICGVIALLVTAAFIARSGEPAALRSVISLLRWIAIGLAAGTLAGGASALRRARSFDGLDAAASAYRFEVLGDARISAYGASMSAVAKDVDGSPIAKVALSADSAYEADNVLEVVGRISSLEDDQWDRDSFMAGEVARVQVVTVREQREGATSPIDWMRARALDAIDPVHSPARALVAGIVCGRTTELNACEETEAFSETGTTHLIAVSGSHLALISALVIACVRRLRVGPVPRTAVLLVLMASYVGFTGAEPSATRSFCMVAMALASTLGGRRGHGISALSLAAMVLIVVDAGVVFDLGFQLSALSVLFIQVFSGYMTSLLEAVRVPRAVGEALALTLCAQWATLPVTLPVFEELSLVAPLANFVLGPIMSALLVAGVAAVFLQLAFPVLAPILLIPEALANLSFFIAGLMSQLPWASLYVSAPSLLAPACYGIACVVYAVWGSPHPMALGAVVLVALSLVAVPLVRSRWFAPAEIIVMDVGQADAILLREGSRALLVDSGVDGDVVRALLRHGVLHLDAVVITHWDSDHYGGLDELLGTIAVDRLIVADGALAGMPPEIRSLDLPDAVEVGYGDRFVVGGFDCRVVWPQGPVDGDGNEASLVLDVSYEVQGRSLDMLLTGDSEATEASRYAAEVGPVDVLKVGHHGSAESVDAEMLGILAPELAVASAGEGNRYGHPSEECIDALEAAGVPFLCTIDAGDVSISPEEGGFTVAISRGGG